MKFIITESQNCRLWIKRRYSEVEEYYYNTIGLFDNYNFCERYDSFEGFENVFYHFFGEELNVIHYREGSMEMSEDIKKCLKDLFNDRLIEYYQYKCS